MGHYDTPDSPVNYLKIPFEETLKKIAASRDQINQEETL